MNKKLLIGIMLASLFLVSTAYAMNLWMSYSIFDDIQVKQGFSGLYKVQFCDAGCFNQYTANWGTHDNMTYMLKVTVDGTGAKFFKDLPKRTVKIMGDGSFSYSGDGITSYKYDVTLKVPKNAPVGSYPYTLCGTIYDGTGKTITLGLSVCKAGNVNVTSRN